MKKTLLIIMALNFSTLLWSQKISNYIKPWFEDQHAGYSIPKSNNPLLDNYDVVFYKIDLNATNTNKIISGCGTIKARVTGSPMTTLVMDLINSLTIDSVKVDGVIYSSTHTNDEIQVTLSSAIPVDTYFTVEVYYHGTSAGNGIKNGFSPSWGAQITWTLSESYHAKDWFPCKEVLSDKADSAYVFITCANSLKAGSNGLLTNTVTLPGSKVRYEWKTYHPIDYYLLSFTISNYQEYNLYAHPAGIADSVLIQNYIYSNSGYLPYFQAEIDNTPAFIELLSDLYGLYPFYDEKYGHCTAPIGGGMEHQTMTTLSSFSFELIIHELGHQWFGDNVTCSNWQDIWVNEGFATYTHYLGLQHLVSQTDADQEMLNEHNDIMSSPDGSIYVPVAQVFDENRIFDYRLTYEKGAAIIHTMRFVLNNDTLFYNVLKNFQQTYGDSVATGDDFRNMISNMSGIDFTDFFNQWYYGEGFPTYNVSWNQQGNNLNFVLNQQGSMPLITPFFKVPLEIRFSWAGGDTIIRFDQTVNDQAFSAVIPHTVQSLEIDPNNWIINNVGSVVTNIPITGTSVQWQIGPNPANTYLNIEAPGMDLKTTDLVISDITGKSVRSITMASGAETIDISDLPAGIYYIKESSGNLLKPYKFVKVK